MDVSAWLRELGLDSYDKLFKDNAIDAEILSAITEADLEKLGVLLGHRKKIMRAIRQLDQEPAPAKAVAGPAGPANDAGKSGEAERRQLTLMFVDIVGSTALSGRLDPEEMQAIIRNYQEAVTAEVRRLDGHVAKYMGDGVLAYFGWPRAHEDDAGRAVRAGLAISSRVAGVDMPAGHALQTRIGIATGRVVVGEIIGEGGAKEESVVGGTPNLAARLQEIAQPGSVVVSAVTRRLLGGTFRMTDLGAHSLKGLGDAVRAWQVEGEKRSESGVKTFRDSEPGAPVGREQELELLLDRWQQSVQRDGQVVYLSGEAGIGKSCIVQAFRQRIASQPHHRLLCFCSPYHSGTAFYPVLEQIERAAGYLSGEMPESKLAKLEALLSQGTDQIDEAVSLIAQALQIPTGEQFPAGQMSPQKQRSRTIEIFIEQVVGLADGKPLLIVLEDAHWIDPSTQDVYERLIDLIRTLPVLILITFRPSFSPPWYGNTPTTHLSLNRLTDRQGAAMLDNIAGGRSFPTEVRAQILEKTDGVPIFVEELTHMILESGLLAEKDGHFELTRPLPELAIPETLHDSLMARLDGQAPGKAIAQIGSVIGREFDHELLAEIALLPGPALQDGLDRLVESRLILRRGSQSSVTYVFRHALIQETAYRSLLRSKRKELHARIALALEDRFPNLVSVKPEVMAHHFEKAGLAQKAVGYWKMAGEQAMKRSANAEAIRYISKGLELVGSLPDDDERSARELELQLTQAPPLMALRGHSAPEVGQLFERISILGGNVRDQDVLFRALWGSWRFHFIRAEHDAAQQIAERCVAAAGEHNDPAQQQVAALALGGSLLWRGSYALADARIDIAVNRLEPQLDRSLAFEFGQDPAVTSLGYSAFTQFYLGFPDQALQRSSNALELAGQLGHPATLAAMRTYSAMILALRREWEEALACADLAIAISSEQGFPQHLGIGLIIRGRALAELAGCEQGASDAKEGIAMRRSIGSFICDPYYSALLAEALCAADRVDDGLDTIRNARALAVRTGEGFCQPEIIRVEGLLWAKSNRDKALDKAIDCFRQALDLAITQGSLSLELRAATSLAAVFAKEDRMKEARQTIKTSFDRLTEGFETADHKDAKALIAELA